MIPPCSPSRPQTHFISRLVAPPKVCRRHFSKRGACRDPLVVTQSLFRFRSTGAQILLMRASTWVASFLQTPLKTLCRPWSLSREGKGCAPPLRAPSPPPLRAPSPPRAFSSMLLTTHQPGKKSQAFPLTYVVIATLFQERMYESMRGAIERNFEVAKRYLDPLGKGVWEGGLADLVGSRKRKDAANGEAVKRVDDHHISWHRDSREDMEDGGVVLILVTPEVSS